MNKGRFFAVGVGAGDPLDMTLRAVRTLENSDAVVLVVSEETGQISIARNGIIVRDFNFVTLKEELYNSLLKNDDKKKGLFTELFGRIKKK